MAPLAAVLLVAGCSAGSDAASTSSAPSIEGVETVDDLGSTHVEGPVEYEQTPPVGGDHNARWLACDVYDEPVPPESAVHSMEHGAVWLTYRPDLPATEVEQLASLAELDPDYVLVTPFEGLPSPVVASAWGLQLQVDGADDPRLRTFVETYAGEEQGGEPGPPPCREGGVTPEQAREVVGG